MAKPQQGDVKLVQTVDGGDIEVDNGVVTMSGGLETMAYLCLFGGNEDDSGKPGDPLTWWGNLSEEQDDRKYRSETQHLLRSLPARPSNLRRVEEAAKRDLKAVPASDVEAAASIPGVNKINIAVTINGNMSVEFTENWEAAL